MVTRVSEQLNEQNNSASIRGMWGTIFYNAKVYDLVGDGTTNDYTNLYNLINTTINGAEATIIFPKGTYKISSNITIPSNVSLYFVKGAMLSPDSGKTITINGPVEAGLWQIFTGSGTIAGSMIVDAVYPQWWGAKGDGVTDDYTALQAVLNMNNVTKIIFGDISNHYLISAGLMLPYDVEIDLGSCIISANFSTGNILTTKPVPSGKKTFLVTGNRPVIGGYGVHAGSSTLNGLWINTCNFSIFKGLVFQACEHPIVVGSTGGDDIKSLIIEGIETNTNKGLKILSGVVGGVDYNAVTDGTVRDCFWSCTGAGAKAVEVICNDHAGAVVSSVFGISFIRNALNPTHVNGGTMIDMRAGGSSTIYNMNFENCEGELRYTGSTPTLPIIYLDSVNLSEFDVKGYFHEADGVQLVDSSNNTFKNMIFGVIDPTTTGRFFVFDTTSHANKLENCFTIFKEMSTELGVTNAAMSADFFTKRIVDNGLMNSASGIMTSHPQRVLNTNVLNLITSTGSDLIHPWVSGQQATSAWVKNADGTFTVTMTDAGFYFRVPSEVPLGTKIVVRLKYKFNSALGSLDGWCIKTSSDSGSVRTVLMLESATYIDQQFMTNVTTRENRVMSTVSQAGVILQIAKLEIFIGGFPYPANYAPADIVRDTFTENPYFDTSQRPAFAGVPVGFTYYDTALEKLVTSNGTQWRSNGSIV